MNDMIINNVIDNFYSQTMNEFKLHKEIVYLVKNKNINILNLWFNYYLNYENCTSLDLQKNSKNSKNSKDCKSVYYHYFLISHIKESSNSDISIINIDIPLIDIKTKLSVLLQCRNNVGFVKKYYPINNENCTFLHWKHIYIDLYYYIMYTNIPFEKITTILFYIIYGNNVFLELYKNENEEKLRIHCYAIIYNYLYNIRQTIIRNTIIMNKRKKKYYDYVVSFFEKHILYNSWLNNYHRHYMNYMSYIDKNKYYDYLNYMLIHHRNKTTNSIICDIITILINRLKNESNNDDLENLFHLLHNNIDMIISMSKMNMGCVILYRMFMFLYEKNIFNIFMTAKKKDSRWFLLSKIYYLTFNNISNKLFMTRNYKLQVCWNKKIECYICMEPIKELDYYIICDTCGPLSLKSHVKCCNKFGKCGICKKLFNIRYVYRLHSGIVVFDL